MTLSGAKEPHNTFMIYRPYDSGGFLEPKGYLSKTLILLFHIGIVGTTIEQGHFEIKESVDSRYASSPAPSWGGIPGPGPAQSHSLTPSIGLSSPAGSEVCYPPSQAQPSPLQPKSPYPAKYAALKRMSSSTSTAQYTSDLDIAGMFAFIFHL